MPIIKNKHAGPWTPKHFTRLHDLMLLAASDAAGTGFPEEKLHQLIQASEVIVDMMIWNRVETERASESQ